MLTPLGKPNQRSTKYFAAIEIFRCLKDKKWLSKATIVVTGAIFTLPWFLECLVSPWGSLPGDRINTMQLSKCFSDLKCFSKATKIVSGN